MYTFEGFKVILIEVIAVTIILPAACENIFTSVNINEVSYGYSLGSHNVLSFLDCCMTCSKLDTCRSVTYNMVSRKCDLNLLAVFVPHLTCNGVSCLDLPVVKYAIKQTACLTSMRYNCSSNSDCVDSSSECRDDICKCTPGMHHNPNTCGCVAACDVYGTTFQSELTTVLRQNNLKVISGIPEAECAQRCIVTAPETCRSFDYKYSASVCRIQELTSADASTKVQASTTLFTRDCALNTGP